MGDTISKTKFFIFLSIICLLINLSVCCVAYIKNEQDINSYMMSTDYTLSGDIPPNNNVTISNFVLATGTSFVPYFSIVSITFLNFSAEIWALLSIILAIIGTLQLFLIVVIILNMLPFFNV